MWLSQQLEYEADAMGSSLMKKYLDRATVGPADMRRLQLLLCLAFVMCGWSFRSVKSPFFVNFCQSLRPKFDCPSKCCAALACNSTAFFRLTFVMNML